ncbi:MAG: flagellar hook-length control protein FliK [Candidatus Nitrohelix vancouverensis]|uniref:Flagellar hook-length control protein FliK n=1 Tax=Candidatus Nitrohelix vancouverensis TaxID=2705534 RepID=A0A7T0C3S3_9BACT|nr:MAG: flagellar hook-length control protein FliK [Candidatus Nitrohelix vancouverensis]
MQINELSAAILKILSGESGGGPDAAFLKSLQVGQILNGAILKILPQGKALVDFQGRSVMVQTQTPLSPGQQISARIEQAEPNPVLKIIPTPHTAPLEPRGDSLTLQSRRQSPEQGVRLVLKMPDEQGLASKLQIRQGAEVTATVTRAPGNDSLVVTANHRTARLKLTNEIPLRPGDTFTIQSQPDNQLTLKFSLPAAPERPAVVSPAMLRPYLPTKSDMSALAEKLQTLTQSLPVDSLSIKDKSLLDGLGKSLQSLTPQADRVPGEQALRRATETQTKTLESKLLAVLQSGSKPDIQPHLQTDLKSQLLGLQTLLEKPEAGPSQTHIASKLNISEIISTIRGALDTLEFNQLSQQFAKQESQPLVLNFPNPFSQQDKSFKVYVRKMDDSEEGEARQGDPQGFNAVFMLDLTALGALQIDAKVHNRNVSVQFAVENESIAGFIEMNLPELTQALNEIGYSGIATCCIKKQEEMVIDDALEKLLVTRDARLVDVQT